MFRGRRLQRIDRALSHVLSAIDDAEDERRRTRDDWTWRDLDELSIEFEKRRGAAYDRAAKLEQMWKLQVLAASES